MQVFKDLNKVSSLPFHITCNIINKRHLPVFQLALKPFFSTDASDLNLIIIRLEAVVYVIEERSWLPDKVTSDTLFSSVLPPT